MAFSCASTIHFVDGLTSPGCLRAFHVKHVSWARPSWAPSASYRQRIDMLLFCHRIFLFFIRFASLIIAMQGNAQRAELTWHCLRGHPFFIATIPAKRSIHLFKFTAHIKARHKNTMGVSCWVWL